MPIYEYRREDGTTFELMQAMADDSLTVDPETGQAVTRVLYAPAVHFKGSGFYNTDYGTKRRAREREQEASANGASKDATTSDATSSSKDAASTSSDTTAKPKSEPAKKAAPKKKSTAS